MIRGKNWAGKARLKSILEESRMNLVKLNYQGSDFIYMEQVKPGESRDYFSHMGQTKRGVKLFNAVIG